MASTTNDEAPSLSTVANTPTGDTATRVDVIASNMHPLLLAAASKGNWEELNYLLNGEDAQGQPTMMPSQEFLDQRATYNLGQRATADVEEGAMVLAPSAASLLEGVTVEGDTALHVVAARGEGRKFLKCADLIHGMDKRFLFEPNKKGDTPLHCAARAGKSQMISHLIGLARREQGGDKIVQDLLRKENKSNETALHEAVRIGNIDLVELLLLADSKLAMFPKEGMSPLYLAILLEKDAIARILHDMSEDNDLSYSGPCGQNALHAAVLRQTGMIKDLLEWNKGLTTQADINGSTPLHFISSQSGRSYDSWGYFKRIQSYVKVVFKANKAPLYQPDNCGLFPLHVAASVGATKTIAIFLKDCPGSAGLRDTTGRTFLHVAVAKGRRSIVKFACRTPSLAWILNMQDNDGNTALHLAVQDGSLRMFSALFGNRQVDLNLTNAKGQTPLDISRCKIPLGMNYNQNIESLIHNALKRGGARYGCCRWDHFQGKHINQEGLDYKKDELKRLKDSTQTQCIGSVLIATVTFGATFAIPGGYKADDHNNGGTATLAGRYGFDAFVMANTLAFICSTIATIGLMFSGTSMIDLKSRGMYFNASVLFISSSVTSLSAAFALGVYTVLAPVAHNIAVAVCVMSPLVVLSKNMEILIKLGLLARPLCVRMGLLKSLMWLGIIAAVNMILEFWPFIVIFCSASARNHHHH
ncbi:protein ACCELERATED CELL DEATH 6-like [Phragmites australis]|uniref:protein ACCELERATED CELL DEATH 6-like n=1 Tax=Phragmites australis TaxID=29695 RepID=UPI002D7686DD|nr:protein ACCELERATED CELL DEATH 6-like [Phragmites australis]